MARRGRKYRDLGLGIFAAGCLLAVPLPAAAQEGQSETGAAADRDGRAASAPRAFRVSGATGAMRVDARLDEDAWLAADVIPLPFEITPADNTPARFRTECRVTSDREHLYLGCRAWDPDPGSIRTYVTGRDRILGNHDRISFLIDPFNDARRGWVFEVSPLGVQADLVYDERTGQFDASWDAIWQSAGRITDDGYVVEAALPFSSLRFPAGADATAWRFWINRMRPRSETVIMRSNTRLRDQICQLCQANLLVGLGGMEPGMNVELAPTLTAQRTDSRPTDATAAGLVRGPVRWEPGLDARWSPTTDLTVNGTLNPDFSQVEADAPQLGANSRFALFFPEKRPFFLEGADLFQTPFRAVFTRTIAEPVAGLKLTGKTGPHALGVLVVRDEVNNLLLPGDGRSTSTVVDEGVTSALVRYRRDLPGGHTVGALYTGRMGEQAYANHLAGADAFFRLGSPLTLNLQVLASRTRYDEGTPGARRSGAPFGGTAYRADLRYDDGAWNLTAGTDVREPGFRADAGFIPQVDFRAVWVEGGRTFWGGEDAFLTRTMVRGGVWRDRTLADRLIEEGAWMNVRAEGPHQSVAWLNPFRTRSFHDGRSYELLALNAGLGVRPGPDVRVDVEGFVGDAIDFRNGGEGRSVRLTPSLEVRPTRRTEIQLRHSVQWLDAEGRRVFTENAGQLLGIYNFTPRASIRGTVQYRRIRRDPAANPGLERSLEEEIFGQVLFSYQLNPLTVAFIGVADDRAGHRQTEGPGLGLQPRSRTFFFKLGYAWRP